jgi:hypothetical protein
MTTSLQTACRATLRLQVLPTAGSVNITDPDFAEATRGRGSASWFRAGKRRRLATFPLKPGSHSNHDIVSVFLGKKSTCLTAIKAHAAQPGYRRECHDEEVYTMTPPEGLREKAALCRRLASGLRKNDPTGDALLSLAREFDAKTAGPAADMATNSALRNPSTSPDPES